MCTQLGCMGTCTSFKPTYPYPIRLVYLNSCFVLETTFDECHVLVCYLLLPLN